MSFELTNQLRRLALKCWTRICAWVSMVGLKLDGLQRCSATENDFFVTGKQKHKLI